MSKKQTIENKKLVGKEFKNKFGSTIIMTEYRANNDIDVYFPEYNWTRTHTSFQHFKNQQTSCPYEPRTYGHGYLGEGQYTMKRGEKCFDIWRAMISRCYNEETYINHPTYKKCTVCDEWLNYQNFCLWFENNYYEISEETMCLDKDILIKGNTIYSPETCCFVPSTINNLFTNRKEHRGKYLIGVSKASKNRYTAYLNKKDKRVRLGTYLTEEDAFMAYKTEKEEYIKQVADLYINMIPDNLYQAMYDWTVDMND